MAAPISPFPITNSGVNFTQPLENIVAKVTRQMRLSFKVIFGLHQIS